MPKLVVQTEADSYRLTCPNGHQVAPTNDHWYCHQCARWGEDVEPELEECIDAMTGQRLSRDDVDLDFDTPGVYLA